MKRKTIGLILGLSLAILTSFSFGQDLLIKNGTILTVTKGTIPKGDILVIKGIIKQVGENIKAPKGIKIIDASGKYVIPGIIDSHTHIALTGTNESAEAITAEVKMRDVLNAEDRSIYTAISGGVTMVHTMHGSGNPIGGENIVLKTKWGKTSEEMIVHDAYRTLKFALGENVVVSF
jgi:imidazolonepropionase-like amidohydrolase